MPGFHVHPPVAPIEESSNIPSQTASDSYHDSGLHHPPSLATLPWNDPRLTYTPGHYTPRNLRRDHLLQSNEYHRRRVEAVIKYSADFQRSKLNNVQEDDDLMYCFTLKPHVRLIEPWVEIFLTTPQCYLKMALEEVRLAFLEQTTRVPNTIQIHSGQPATSTAQSLKRKTVIAKDSVHIQQIDVEDNSVEEHAADSYKRSRNENTAPTTEQFLSVCSSSDLDGHFERIVSELTAQYSTASYATISYAPMASTTTILMAPAVAVASQGQPTVPATITPAIVAVQPSLADPIAAMMAHYPTRNMVDVSGRGFKGVAMSRGQIRAHLEIEGRTLATLPSSANSNDRHEMRGVAPPRTVDPTLINCVTAAQEMLTFLPYQTVNYELWDRIRKSWAPKEIADFMAYAR